jgi:hypothetical protein
MLAAATMMAAGDSKEQKTIGSDGIVVGGIRCYYAAEFPHNANEIFVVNEKKGEKRLIYTSPFKYVDWISVSPQGTLISAIEPETETKNRLVVINIDGKTVHLITDDVRKYEWSPDGSMIAYLTGIELEEGIGFKPTGAFIFDVVRGVSTPIVKDFPYPKDERYKGSGYDLKWAAHDSNLYITEFDWAGGNYMYDPRTGKTQPVLYKGIYFSPDGRFYFDRNPEDAARLYITATNEDIGGRVKSRFGYLPEGWVDDMPHHIHVIKVEYEPSPEDSLYKGRPRVWVKGTRKVVQTTHQIFDVEREEVVKEWVEKE